MATCLEYHEERIRECDSWGIFSFICVGWTWVTTSVCVLWDTATTVANAAGTTAESTIGWVLTLVSAVVELVEMIPVVGTIVRWIINGISYGLGILQSLADVVMGAAGIRPEKLLRVCTVILRDEKGNPMALVEDVVPMLQLAANVYKRDANVRIIPSRPFKYTTGFLGPELVDESWIQVDPGNSDTDILDSPCNAGGEWGLTGSKFQAKETWFCLFGAWRRVFGYGSPITIFIDRGSTPLQELGCGLGIVDYVTVHGIATIPGNPNQSQRDIGHEIGHECMLVHTCVDDSNGPNNMMASNQNPPCPATSITPIDRANPRFSDWQNLLVRSNKHVTYF